MKLGITSTILKTNLSRSKWLPRVVKGSVKAIAIAIQSEGKVMATILWDTEGILLVDVLVMKRIVTSANLRKLIKDLAKEHHENVPVHSCHQTKGSLREF